MAKAGRPTKELDKELFEKACFLHCNQQEICRRLGEQTPEGSTIDVQTLHTWVKRVYGQDFSEVYEQKKARGKFGLRAIQYKLSEKNVAMAIFLGKQWLGQKDVQDVVHAGEINTALRTGPNLSSLTDAELEQLREYAQRIKPTE